MLIALLAIPLLAVAVLGILSYRNSRFIVRDLSTRLLKQTSGRIHDQIRDLLDRAALVGRVEANLVGAKAPTQDDLRSITEEFREVMLLHPEFTYLSLGLETGDYCHVRRVRGDELEISINRFVGDGRAERTDYRLSDGKWKVTDRRTESYDPRKRPFYRAAKKKGRQTWPKVYLFKNGEAEDFPGLTCATPVRGPAGRFIGVVTTDFDLRALGGFLDKLQVFKSGFAFVVEKGTDGPDRVIAHPDPKVIVGKPRGAERSDILPLDQVRSGPIRAFMKKIGSSSKDGGHPGRQGFSRLTFSSDETEFVGAYRPLASAHDLGWLIGIVVPQDELMARVRKNNRQTATIGVVSLLISLITAVLLAALISRPLRQLAKETEAIGKFQLDPNPEVRSALVELERLASSMEEMKAGLRSFRKYVPAELVRAVLTSGSEAVLGGRRKVLSVYFSDISNFTSIAEGLAPEELVEFLGEYLEAMSRGIGATGGTVDKYIGDAVMAFWGAPKDHPDHARAACTAALRNLATLRKLNEKWNSEGRPALATRIGINTGELIVGNMGSATRLNYTVVGDSVNLASRLEGLNKFYGTEAMISETTYEQARDWIVARPLEKVSVKGKEEGVLVYELLGLTDEADKETVELAELSEEAISTYYEREFSRAEKLFAEILEMRPSDVAAKLLSEECRRLADSPPPPDWDGIRRMEKK